MHMMELFRLGNSFIFQLKNGNFLISDGGMATDLPYLLDYLDSLVPEGEKPIVDGWIISHAHGDHCGALCEFSKQQGLMERIELKGIYYSEPNEEKVLRSCGCAILNYEIKWVAWRFKCPVYRPQTGQRFHFSGVTMDILLAQEQMDFGKHRDDLNTSSTVCMFTVEGQKLLFSGDIRKEGTDWMIANYSKEYLDVDFFTLNHHGLDIERTFAEYIRTNTMLLTVREDVPIRKIRETKILIAKAKESVVWGDGTKIFTFPYTVGSYQLLPQNEWIYHKGQVREPQANLYTCPGKLLKGWIFDAETTLFKGENVRKGVPEFLAYLQEQGVKLAAFTRGESEVLAKRIKDTLPEVKFEIVLGEQAFLDMALEIEKQFGFSHIYYHVIVTRDLNVVQSVTKDGFKTLIPTWGEELTPEMQWKCWHTFGNFETIYEDFIEYKKVYFKEKYEGDLG
jgi:hypothetical protein